MPRPPRIDIPGLPQHLVLRGHDRKPCFFGDDFRQLFLRYLKHACAFSSTELHAYVLMTNHVHLLVTGQMPGSISKLMHSAARRYSRTVNSTLERTGTLFEGRFRSSLVQSEAYFLACMRYVEMNPVRAGLARRPSEYAWSSYAENASGAPSGILSPHAEYQRLGSDSASRGLAYRLLFNSPLSDSTLAAIRDASAKERALGEPTFLKMVSGQIGREVGPVRQGRPRIAVEN